MRTRIAWLFGAIALLAAAFLLHQPDEGPPAVSIQFTRFDSAPLWPGTNFPCAVFELRNSGSRPLYSRGVGASSAHLHTQFMTPAGWTDSEHPWPMFPGSKNNSFHLLPGQSHEVGVFILDTNAVWRVGFKFRRLGGVDWCPRIVWERLPDKAQTIPPFQVVWSERVPAKAGN